MKKTVKKKTAKSQEVKSEKNVSNEITETVEKSVISENTCQVSDKNKSCDCCEAPEELSFDFIQIHVKGNGWSINSKGFTEEQEKAIAMTMFQMRNRFGLETEFSVQIRKR